MYVEGTQYGSIVDIGYLLDGFVAFAQFVVIHMCLCSNRSSLRWMNDCLSFPSKPK
jgi:hypothetical protein